MTPYAFAFVGVLLGGLLQFGKSLHKPPLLAAGVGGFCLWILLALRDATLGIDLPSYLAAYDIARDADLRSGERIFNFEPGFSYYMVGLNSLGVEPRGFIMVTALVTVGTIALMVGHLSVYPALSMYLYATIGLYSFAFSGLRQALAVGLCALAYLLLTQGRRKSFLAVVVLAVTIHQSALVFLPVYVLARLRSSLRSLLFGIAAVAIVYTFREPIYALLHRLYREGEGSPEQTGASTLFIVYFLLWIASFSVTSGDQNLRPHEDIAVLRNLFFGAVILQAMAGASSLIGRTAQYFLLFGLLLIPALIKRQKDPTVRTLLVAVTVVFGWVFFNYQAAGLGLLEYSGGITNLTTGETR